MKQEIKLYNGTVTIYFEEKDWNGKKIHLYTNEKGEKIESNTGVTGIIDKSTPLMWWTSRVNAERTLMDLGIVPEYYFSEIKKENQKQWDCLEQNAIDLKLGTSNIIKSVRLGRNEYRDKKETAADIGTMIHEWIDKWINLKKRPPMPEDEKVKNGVIAFLDWFGKNHLEFIVNERIVYSLKHNVIGRLDGITNDLDDCYLSLEDFKSSNGIYEEMVLQTAGYLMMIEEEINYLLSIPFESIKSPDDKKLVKLYKKYGGFKKRRILKFGKDDGMFEVREFNNHKKDIKGFLAAFVLKNRVGELKKELHDGHQKI